MKEIKKYFNIWLVLAVVSAALCVVCAVGVTLVKRGHHAFRDMIIGEVSLYASNRTGELRLFAFMLGLGIVLTAALAFFWESEKAGEEKENNCFLQAISCFLPLLFSVTMFGKLDGRMLVLSIVFAVVSILDSDWFLEGAAFFLCIYFALFSIETVLAVFFDSFFLGDNKIFVCALIVFCAGKTAELWIGRISQLLLPLLLLSYIKDRYETSQGIQVIPFSKRYSFLILTLIVTLVAYQVFALIVKNKQKLTFASAFCIAAFVSYTPAAMLTQNDLHHHGEQLIAWQQILEFGQKAYDGYAPASGLFPMIIGGINSLFFHGKVNEYAMSLVIFTLLFELVTFFLLYRRVGGELAIMMAFVFHMPSYCRVWILLPVLLILSEQALLKNRIKWLIAWVALIFLSGLYYPLFGAALFLGSLPVGAVIFWQMLKQKEYRKLQKKEAVFALALALAILLAAPLLIRMAKHILTLANQTVDVDGMAILGYELPAYFMPYLAGTRLQRVLYILARFVLGIPPILLWIYLATRVVKKSIEDGKRDENRLSAFLFTTGMPLVMLTCYRYTMVCMDEEWVANLLSRSVFIIVILGAMGLIVFLKEHGKDYLGKKSLTALLATCFAIPFFFFYSCDDCSFPYVMGRTDAESFVILSYADKLRPYSVADEYQCITEEGKATYSDVEFERIGEGFVQTAVLQNLEMNEKMMAAYHAIDPDIRVLGFEHSQLYYMLLGEKAVYSGRTAIAKDLQATRELIKQVDLSKTIVRESVTSVDQYYLYRYLARNDYCYLDYAKQYLPAEVYAAMTGGQTGSLANSPWTEEIDLNDSAAAFAKSIKTIGTLQEAETTGYQTLSNGASLNIVLDQEVDGYQNDVLYLKLNQNGEKRIIVEFPSQLCEGGIGRIRCNSKDGELLIPIGMNAGWLLGQNKSFSIQAEDESELGVEDMKFYHLEDL